MRRRTWPWAVLGAVLIAMLVLVEVRIAEPRIAIRWAPSVDAAQRLALERRHDLRNGQRDADTSWRYDLGTQSRESIRALIADPAVEDTGYIDRERLTTAERSIRITMRSWPYPFREFVDRPSQLLQLHVSLWLLLAGGVLLRTARVSSERRRRNVTVATLLLVGIFGVTMPITSPLVHMGESREHAASRENFERHFGGPVQFDKHLLQTILLQVYARFDPTDAAPERALIAVSRGATAWFVLSALAIGFLERWSAVVLRYLALGLLAPSALLYFGWREFGYLSLNIAAFPLLARGLRDGGARLEAGGALTGLGAALHGSGLVALAGTGLAALGTSGMWKDRVDRFLRVAAWATAAYLGWIAIYVIAMKRAVGLGQPTASPWRPWLVDEVREGRLSAAILSGTAVPDLLMAAWVIGAPLLVVALFVRRQSPHEVRAAWWYLLPSILFEVSRWPLQGIGGGTDLIVAGFPAFYALAWACAQDSKPAYIGAGLLVSAHYAFWRICLDPRFVTRMLDGVGLAR